MEKMWDQGQNGGQNDGLCQSWLKSVPTSHNLDQHCSVVQRQTAVTVYLKVSSCRCLPLHLVALATGFMSDTSFCCSISRRAISGGATGRLFVLMKSHIPCPVRWVLITIPRKRPTQNSQQKQHFPLYPTLDSYEQLCLTLHNCHDGKLL